MWIKFLLTLKYMNCKNIKLFVTFHILCRFFSIQWRQLYIFLPNCIELYLFEFSWSPWWKLRENLYYKNKILSSSFSTSSVWPSHFIIIQRYNRAAQYIYWSWCRAFNLPRKESGWEFKPPQVLEDEQVIILWNFSVPTD